MRIGSTRVFAKAAILAVAQQQAGDAASLDSLQVVGQFAPVTAGCLVFGDSNHDGSNEILLRAVAGGVDVVRVLEQAAPNQWVLKVEIPGLIPLAIGDVDQDGKTDLVGQLGSVLRVFESSEHSSFPTELVWQASLPTTFEGAVQVADTDRDGALEIIYSVPTFSNPRIFECVSDNSYVLRFPQPSAIEWSMEKRVESLTSSQSQAERLFVSDIDHDGTAEILDCDSQNNLRILESVANDMWTRTATLPTGLINTRVVVGGIDADHDGLSEIWIAGDNVASFDRRILILEPNVSGSLSCVDTLITSDGQSGEQYGTLAQLEPSGGIKFVWNLSGRLEIYSLKGAKWSAADTIGEPQPRHYHVRAADVNRNGRDELYWLGHGLSVSSLIYERPTVTSAVGSQAINGNDGQIGVFPTPVRAHAAIWCSPGILSRARRTDLFDAAGRLIRTRGAASGLGPDMSFSAMGLVSGVYFLRVCNEKGDTLASTRILVTR